MYIINKKIQDLSATYAMDSQQKAATFSNRTIVKHVTFFSNETNLKIN